MNIIDCIAYCNFEKGSFPRNHQTDLQNYGIQFRHVSDHGKNCSDLMMTTDVITTLYKNPNIYKFALIAGGWDITPLLKLIRLENKSAAAILSKDDYDPDISCFVEHWDFLEDIFNLAPKIVKPDQAQEINFMGQDNLIVNNTPKIMEHKNLSHYRFNAWNGANKQGIRFH